MAWRGLAVVTAVFIAISAPLASRPTFKGLLGGADDSTPATRTSRRRATAAGRKLAVTRRRQSIARGAGGFAVAPYPRAHTCFNRIDVPLYRTKEELVGGFEFVLELGDQTFTMD